MSESSGDPVATVVVATHDRPDSARAAIRSALAQTVGDVEVIVVDDGSDPPFVPDVDDPRLRLLRRDRAGGMCAARNDGLRIARGRWIVFLDDDDVLHPAMVERALQAAETSTLPSPVAVMTGLRYVTPDGQELETCRAPTLPRGADYFLEAVEGDFRAKNALVMPTDVVRAIGGWGEAYESFEADDFGIRLNRVASIQGLDEPLYSLTHHDAPRLTARLGAIARDMKRTVAEHGPVFRRHPARYAHYLSTIGVYDLRSGRWGSAVWWCLRGVVRDPRRGRRWKYLGAALAGPYVLSAYRRLCPRGSTVSGWTLAKRRVRKYGKRLLRYPRAALAGPFAAVTGAVARRRIVLRTADAARHVLVCSVYRETNAGRVAALLAEPIARGWDLRLWALDRVDPRLEQWTVGVGPGAKFPLLDRMLAGQELEAYDWVVVTDDDLRFPRGSVVDLLAVAEAAGLDFVQPAHTELSHADHAISVRRSLAVARRTTFVEIGPLFAIRRPWVSRVVPFPPDHAMGWGLELEWFDLEREGARLGIVDSVPIRHLGRVGEGYAKWEEEVQLRARLRERGLRSFQDIQRTVAVWRLWQPVPPWTAEGGHRVGSSPSFDPPGRE